MVLVNSMYHWEIALIMRDNIKIEAARHNLPGVNGFIQFFDINGKAVLTIKEEHFIYAKRGDRIPH